MPDAVDRRERRARGRPRQGVSTRVVHEIDDHCGGRRRISRGRAAPSPPIPTEVAFDQSRRSSRSPRWLPTERCDRRPAPPRPPPSPRDRFTTMTSAPARPSAAITLRAAPPAPSTTQRSPATPTPSAAERPQKPSPSVLCPTSVPSRFSDAVDRARSACGFGGELVDELHTPRPCGASSPTAPAIPMARTPSSARRASPAATSKATNTQSSPRPRTPR